MPNRFNNNNNNRYLYSAYCRSPLGAWKHFASSEVMPNRFRLIISSFLYTGGNSKDAVTCIKYSAILKPPCEPRFELEALD